MERTAFTGLFASATGLLLSVAGLVGFAVGSEFAEPSLTAELLGFYPVNGWVNGLHLATGLAALLLSRIAPTAWALIGGLLYAGLGLWGVLAPDGQLLAGVLPATRVVNGINLAIGLTGLAAFATATLPGAKLPGVGRRRRMRRARRRRRRVSGTSARRAGGDAVKRQPTP